MPGYCRIVRQSDKRYDAGMTTSKIAISLPKEQLARVRREVRAGRADSVSGYIARALEEQERRESLQELLRDLTTFRRKNGVLSWLPVAE
jgi:Arc/MetJ-type ribon-helix-helix transcriptional regulator